MTSSPPRVLHLSGRSFWCGESNRVLVICRGLLAAGWPVLLGVAPSSPLAQHAAGEGIPMDTRFAFRRGFRPVSLFRDVMALRRLHREQPVDIVHLHTSVDTWIAALAFGFRRRSRKGRPVLVRTRHSDHRCQADPVHCLLYRRVLDHVVLSADALRQPLAGLFRRGAIIPARMSVIHSSVNVHRFDPARVSGEAVRKEFELENRFCIGLVGRISSEKGHDLLLAALPGVLREVPRAVVVFAGEGDREAQLRQEVANGPLREHVLFCGFRRDIPEITAAMDILVVPSRRVEASPGVVKEAMAMGKPVVATGVGGVAEIINHGETGLVIPAGDVAALEAALRRLIREPAFRQRLAGQARAAVTTAFSDERLVANNMELYTQLAGASL